MQERDRKRERERKKQRERDRQKGREQKRGQVWKSGQEDPSSGRVQTKSIHTGIQNTSRNRKREKERERQRERERERERNAPPWHNLQSETLCRCDIAHTVADLSFRQALVAVLLEQRKRKSTKRVNHTFVTGMANYKRTATKKESKRLWLCFCSNFAQ